MALLYAVNMHELAATVSNREVKARWAYSELLSPRAVRNYPKTGIEDIFLRRKENIVFSSLLPSQMDRLADAFAVGRLAFVGYLEEAPRFQLVELSIADVCGLNVLPQLGTGTVLNWAVGSREGAHDARLQSDACLGDIGQTERVVVAGANTLIDGYFRTMRFLRRASVPQTLPAFVAL